MCHGAVRAVGGGVNDFDSRWNGRSRCSRVPCIKHRGIFAAGGYDTGYRGGVDVGAGACKSGGSVVGVVAGRFTCVVSWDSERSSVVLAIARVHDSVLGAGGVARDFGGLPTR